MMKEYIWGCELNLKNKEYVWDISDDMDNEMTCTLLLKQATLATCVPDNQVNVVALETVGISDPVVQPLFRLTAGKTDQCQLDVLIAHPGSKISLLEGSGPVYIWGQQLFEYVNDDGTEKDDSAAVEEEEDEAVTEEEAEEEENEEAQKEEFEFLNGDTAKIELAMERSKKRQASGNQERSRKKVA